MRQFSEQRAPEFAPPDQTAEYSAELHHTSCSGHVRSNVDPYLCSVSLAGTPVVFEIDTGAAVTIINKAEYQTLASKDTKQRLPSLETNDLPSLRLYAGKIIPVIGRLICNARHAKNSAQLTMFVLEASGPNLLGRDALQTLKLNWNRVFNVTGDLSSDLLSKHSDVFNVTNISRDHLCAPFFGTKRFPFVCTQPCLAVLQLAVCSTCSLLYACTRFWLPCMSRCAPLSAHVSISGCHACRGVLSLCACIRFWLPCMSRCAPLSAHVSVSGCYSSRCASLALLCVHTSISGCTRMPISAFALTPEESLEPSMDPVIRM